MGLDLKPELVRFRELIAEQLGLQFEDAKLGFLEEVLRRQVAATHFDEDEYLRWLARPHAVSELGQLAQELTVAETYFFRNSAQFRALRDIVLPDRIHAAGGKLRILSAGCATGEEAYTIAMHLRDYAGLEGWDARVSAVDVSPNVLERAKRARYSAWALRETPDSARERWFTPVGKEWDLSNEVKSLVDFEQHNITADGEALWAPERYDVVFCRNVIMYFTPDKITKVVERIARSLKPGGYLFLGHAETLRGLTQRFHLCHTHDTFYYQRKSGPVPAATRFAPNGTLPNSVDVSSFVDTETSWVETIQKASARIQALSAKRTTSTAETNTAPRVRPPMRTWDMHSAIDLLARERFSEALAVIESFPPEAAEDPDVLLLQAVLLTHSGRTAVAEQVCARLLAMDELNAGAHYVLALCHEGSGNTAGAVDHDEAAAYLDPSFAMPRLHLGLLAKKRGDRESARRELTQALALLQREDPPRLLLFGGGFSRDALVALCQAELRATGVHG